MLQNESGKRSVPCGACGHSAYYLRQEREFKGDHHTGAAQDSHTLAEETASGLGFYGPDV